MWNIESTIELLSEMSRSADPSELVRLFFEHIRSGVDVRRVLVVSCVGLSAPQYRLVHNLSRTDASDTDLTMDQLRQGGLLAQLLYLGTFQHLPNFTPAASDPDFDLLQGGGSLMAFPLFDKGAVAGMFVALVASSQPLDPTVLCALATMSSLLGRAIESQKLANQLEETCQALDSELKAAADVQRWLLPSLPALHDMGIAASYRTALYSSGDYYDVGLMPDGRVGILIADVSGKGAAAAVLMAVLRSIVHDEVDREKLIGPAALLDYADSRLRALGLLERSAFITAFCGVCNPATGELVYSCAGHNPPRLLRAADRSILSLDGARTFPLGLLDECEHTEAVVQMNPGDLALFYTDGITEARSADGEFFGLERLDEVLRRIPEPITAETAIHTITRALRDFAGEAPPADDQTLLALVGASPTRPPLASSSSPPTRPEDQEVRLRNGLPC